jgi:hypothetical protein
VPPATARVLCAVTGGSGRAEARGELARRTPCESDLVVDVSPSYILQAGLPYAESRVAVVLDADLTDVPERYRDPERARRLMGVVADAVERGGHVIAPAKEWEIQDYARDARCRVAVFSTADDITARDKKVARAAAWVAGGRILVEQFEQTMDAGPLRPDVPAASQVAATLAAYTLDAVGDRRATPREAEAV